MPCVTTLIAQGLQVPAKPALFLVLSQHDKPHPSAMTSLQPRGPYSQAELEKLYPGNLRLELVQVLLRHGERSPVSARFQNVSVSLLACSVS